MAAFSKPNFDRNYIIYKEIDFQALYVKVLFGEYKCFFMDVASSFNIFVSIYKEFPSEGLGIDL